MTPRIDRGQKIVIASHNRGKIREISELLKPWEIDILAAPDLGISDLEETETSFIGNARLKALHVARETGLPALADDSGLEVAALEGQPGIYSARWAETPTGRDFRHAMERVHHALVSRSAAPPWDARFVCALVLAWPDDTEVAVEGEVRGQLVWPPRGENGFGYDPIFLPAGKTETFGEMRPEEKHAMSHRADAFAKLIAAAFPSK